MIKYTIYKKNENDFKEFILNIKENFTESLNSIHKARNEIKIINHEDKELVVKSFKVPNFINKLVYTFLKDSKAKKSYDNSVKIIDFVPSPIGYIEFTKNGLLADSYFVSENFKYDFTIREPLTNDNFEDKAKVFKEFAKFTYDLHEQNILHLDYSPGNILIKKGEESYIFKIVDINRMTFKKLSLDERLKSFYMLWAKDDDMKTIVKEYAKLVNEGASYCIKKAIYYSQKNKDFKNFKKRLKGIEVVD